MANKYLRLLAGKIKELEALVTSVGAADAGKIVATGADGLLDPSLMPAGIGANLVVAPASENLAAGDFVNLWNDAGTLKVRKADATTNAKPANGFVLAAVTAPANASVYLLSSKNTAKTGLTAGTEYFLGTTAGTTTATAPSAAGNVVQYLGKAVSATEMTFENITTVEVS